MFRISKYFLQSEINLEVFKTAWNYRYNHTTKSFFVYCFINNHQILASMGKSKKNTIAIYFRFTFVGNELPFPPRTGPLDSGLRMIPQSPRLERKLIDNGTASSRCAPEM